MAKIMPFRGIRYNTEEVCLNDVTSPPYDVISPEDKQRLLDLHPANMVRLILGEDLNSDNESENRFTRALSYMDDWLRDRILIRDEKPAIYCYEQSYSDRGKARTIRGFISLVRIEDYSNNVILPHENTLAKPKSHLAPLIRATNANLDSVYALYPDQEHVIDKALDDVAKNPPQGEAVDSDGVRHRLWVVNDPAVIDLITQTLADRQLVIADGHHRYETSLAYRDELRARGGNPAHEMPYDFVMMTLVNVYSPDVIIDPTHRMVKNLSDDLLAGLDDKLQELFSLTASSRDALLDDMANQGGKAIGVYRGGKAELIVPNRDLAELVPGPDALRSLDVILLHRLILDRALGINADRIRQEANVAYTRDGDEAFERVDSGEYQVSFLLNPISLESILDIAGAGERMPQKATYFYPKLLSGLVMRRIEN